MTLVEEMFPAYTCISRPRIRIARGGSRPQHLGMDQAALETALQVSFVSLPRLFSWNSVSSFNPILQDFIVNLAGMEFGAGAHPGLQAIRYTSVVNDGISELCYNLVSSI